MDTYTMALVLTARDGESVMETWERLRGYTNSNWLVAGGYYEQEASRDIASEGWHAALVWC